MKKLETTVINFVYDTFYSEEIARTVTQARKNWIKIAFYEGGGQSIVLLLPRQSGSWNPGGFYRGKIVDVKPVFYLDFKTFSTTFPLLLVEKWWKSGKKVVEKHKLEKWGKK